MTDFEFTQQLNAITWVGEKYFELCQYFYDKILLAQAAICAITLSNDPSLEEKLSYSVSDMQETYLGNISSLKSIHQALINFCEEVGINCNQLIQWMTPPEGRSNIDKYLAFSEVEHDEGFTKYIKNKFSATWEQ